MSNSAQPELWQLMLARLSTVRDELGARVTLVDYALAAAEVARKHSAPITAEAPPAPTIAAAFYGVIRRADVGTRITIVSDAAELAQLRTDPATLFVVPTPRATYDEAYSATLVEQAAYIDPDATA